MTGSEIADDAPVHGDDAPVGGDDQQSNGSNSARTDASMSSTEDSSTEHGEEESLAEDDDDDDIATEDDEVTDDGDDASEMEGANDSSDENSENEDADMADNEGLRVEDIIGGAGLNFQKLTSMAVTDSELDGIVLIHNELEDGNNDLRRNNYKGSVLGRSTIPRDFNGAYERLVSQYFNGADSMYTRDQFCRRFRVSPEIFQRVFSAMDGQGEFRPVSTKNAAGKCGIHPLVRMTAVFRVLAYGDTCDREDENLQIGESTLDNALHYFCTKLVLTFGDQYLNRSPTREERKVILEHNAKRGFPGLFASWDCKHFVWDMCPVYLQGQHKGHHMSKNTVILEAIADGSCYIWYINFGDPGSLNDINVLDKSSIVGSILQGTFDIKTDPYVINNTVRDWMYFLVDGIYPEWAIFVKTIPDSARNDPHKTFFASRQEAVRKDIERSFGILVKKFHILARPLRVRSVEMIRNILYACVILHNMCCEERSTATRRVLRDDDLAMYADEQHQATSTLFGQAVPQNNDIVVMQQARLTNYLLFNQNMTDAIKHAELQRDLLTHNSPAV